MKNISRALILAMAAWSLPVFADSLQQSDVDRFIAKTPAVFTVIASVDQRLSKQEKKRFQASLMKMRPYTTMADMMEEKPDNLLLDGVSQKVGYEDFQHYAKVADRFFSVAMSAQMVEQFSGLGQENPEKINDLFRYLNDSSKPQEKQKRLSESFEKMCQERCVNPDDIEIVAQNYLPLSKVLRLKK